MDRAKSEAEEAVRDAALADIRGRTIMERGRCPRCGSRIETLLFTSVCQDCGWFHRFAPEDGHSVVFMESGETLECDRVLEVEDDQLLCVNGDVVVSRVARSAVHRIDYRWAEGELERARERHAKERSGVCHGCECELGEASEGVPLEDDVAFGAFQERYTFCSERCVAAFRKQYPPRVHGNCYETECRDCDLCLKRYDAQHFRRWRVQG